MDILGIGEPLMEFSAVTREGETLYLPGHGGDTSNAVIAAARLGARSGYFTAIGPDAFGQSFLDLWSRERVDCSTVIRRDPGRTGIYFITHGSQGHEFAYWREGSAASLMERNELPVEQIAATKILHISGISQAISESASKTVIEAMWQARRAGAIISYDTNLRLKLWPLERARKTIHAAVALADIALPGLEDARLLTGLERAEDICDFYLKLGCKIVALTLGGEGTMVATEGHLEKVPAFPVTVVDATGAGDTFDGAFLAEWLRTKEPFSAARFANAAAALSTQGYGAVAPMPDRAAVEQFMKSG